MTEFASAPILAVAISPDGKTAVGASGDRTIGVARLCRPESSFNSYLNLSCDSAKFVGTNTFSSLCYPSEGMFYAASTAGSFVRYNLGDSEEWRPRPDYEVPDAHGTGGELTGISAVSNSSIIVTSGKDATVRCWDPETRQSIARLTGHKYEVRGVAAAESESASGGSGVVNIIASAGRDKTVRLWDVRMSESSPVFVFSGHTGWVHDVAISGGRGRSVIVSCAGDKTVRVWDLSMMRQAQVFTGHEFRVWGVAVSSDGGFAISGSTDTTVRAWDLAREPNAECASLTLEGHRDSVISVAVCRDGTAAVSGCEDGSVFLWNTTGIFSTSSATSEQCALVDSSGSECIPTMKVPDNSANQPATVTGLICDAQLPQNIAPASLPPEHGVSASPCGTTSCDSGLDASPFYSQSESQATKDFTEECTEGKRRLNPTDKLSSNLMGSKQVASCSSAAAHREQSCQQIMSDQMTASTTSRVEPSASELETAKPEAMIANARVGNLDPSADFADTERLSGSATNPEAGRQCTLPINDRLQEVLFKLNAMLAC